MGLCPSRVVEQLSARVDALKLSCRIVCHNLCAEQCIATFSPLSFLCCFPACSYLVISCFSREFYRFDRIVLSVPFCGSLGHVRFLVFHSVAPVTNVSNSIIVCSYHGSQTAVLAFRRFSAAHAGLHILALLENPQGVQNPVPDAQRRNFALAKPRIMLFKLLVPFCWPRRTGQCSVRTSDLGWTTFSLTWFPGSLVEGEPEHAASCSPVLVFWSTFTFFDLFFPSYLCTEVVRSRPVVTPSASTGRFPQVQPCPWCCWLWVEQLPLASPPEPLNWLFRFPLLHIPST